MNKQAFEDCLSIIEAGRMGGMSVEDVVDFVGDNYNLTNTGKRKILWALAKLGY